MPHTFGFPMCEELADADILAELIAVELRISRRIKFLRAVAALGEGAEMPEPTAEEADDGSRDVYVCGPGEDETRLCEALRARVSYRRAYLNVVRGSAPPRL